MKTPSTVLLLALAALLLAAPTAEGGKADPATASTQLAFGVKMAQRGLWNEALFRFKRAESMEPNNPRILNNLAVAYEALGQFDRALEYYQRALKLDSGNAELRKNYSRFVEFYRNFKPDDGGKSTSAAAGDDAAEDGSAPAAETEEGGGAGGAADAA